MKPVRNLLRMISTGMMIGGVIGSIAACSSKQMGVPVTLVRTWYDKERKQVNEEYSVLAADTSVRHDDSAIE